MRSSKWTCPKCSNKQYKVSEMRATSTLFTKLFNIQNRKFTSLTCTKCSYTEFYETSSNKVENVFDFFTN